MLEILQEIASHTKALESELRALLLSDAENDGGLHNRTAMLTDMFAARFPGSVAPGELQGVLRIGRAARHNEPLSPVVAEATLSIAREYRHVIAALRRDRATARQVPAH